MASVGKLFVDFEARTARFEQNVGRAGRSLNRFGRQAKQAQGPIGGLQRRLRSLGSALRSPIAAFAGAASGAIALRKAIGDVSEYELFRARLETATGSVEAAGRAFERLQDFAARTPQRLAEVVDAFTILTNLGLEPSERALISYGNTAAAMGKSLNQLIEAVADATTGEFERLKEFGIKARVEGDRVRFTFRGITTEVANSAEAIQGYLLQLGETQFAGAMERQANTLSASFGNLRDAVQRVSVAFAEGSGLVGLVKRATQALTGVAERIGELDPQFLSVAGKVAVLGTALGGVVASLGAFGILAAGAVVGLKALLIAGGVATAFATLASAAAIGTANVQTFAEFAPRSLNRAFEAIELGAQAAFKAIGALVAETAADMVGAFNSAVAAMGRALNLLLVPANRLREFLGLQPLEGFSESGIEALGRLERELRAKAVELGEGAAAAGSAVKDLFAENIADFGATFERNLERLKDRLASAGREIAQKLAGALGSGAEGAGGAGGKQGLGGKLIGVFEQLEDQLRRAEEATELLGRGAEKAAQKTAKVGEAIKDSLVSAAVEGRKFGDVLEDLGRKLQREILDRLAQAAIGAVFGGGKGKGGGGAGSAIGGAIGSIFGPIGTAIGSIFGGLFADGGKPPVGKASIVGERGPELFVPRTAGTIIPNHAMGGGPVTITQTVNVYGRQGEDMQQTMARMLPIMRQQAIEAVQDASRRGRRFANA